MVETAAKLRLSRCLASSGCDKRRDSKNLVVALSRVRLSLAYNKASEVIKAVRL